MRRRTWAQQDAANALAETDGATVYQGGRARRLLLSAFTAYFRARSVTTVNSQAAMLALVPPARIGDFAVRTDVTKTFYLAGADPTVLGNWKELLTPGSGVISFAGLIGTITKSAALTALGLVDAFVYKGAIDCSANPNYPAADAGDTYKISVAGKIGGASGKVVEVGDTIYCTVDATAAGTQAGVGANWDVIQVNIDGAVVGPASAVDGTPMVADGTTGKLIKNITYAAFKTLLVLVKGDVGLGNVDNTADTAKPVSTAQQTALNLKADLASPALTGTPTVPTAAVDTNTTQAASTAFVLAQAASATPLVDGTATVGTSTRFARGDHIHPTDTTRAALASPTFTGTPAAPTAALGTNTTQLATTAFVTANAAPRGWIDGLTTSNNGGTPNTKVDVAIGLCRDDTDAVNIKFTASKTIDCGTTGANGLDAGALANSTWYHAFAIMKADGTTAALASTSVSAPTMPSGYVYKRILGSFKTDGSAHIVTFIQDGDAFQWTTPVLDINAANPGTAAVTRTLSTPLGVRVEATLVVGFGAGTPATDNPAGILITDLSLTDIAPSVTNATILDYSSSANFFAPVRCRTNTSSQVRSRVQISTAGTTLYIITTGFIHPRGKNA